MVIFNLICAAIFARVQEVDYQKHITNKIIFPLNKQHSEAALQYMLNLIDSAELIQHFYKEIGK